MFVTPAYILPSCPCVCAVEDVTHTLIKCIAKKERENGGEKEKKTHAVSRFHTLMILMSEQERERERGMWRMEEEEPIQSSESLTCFLLQRI